MARITTTQERFEKNLRAHIDYFYERHVGVNSQIRMVYHDCSAEGRWLEITHTVTKGEGNPRGMIHGGITAWLLDTAMGMLNLTLIDTGITPTINMQVNYLEGIPVGSEILIRSHIDRFGRNVLFNSAQIFIGDTLAATAMGSYMRQHAEPAGPAAAGGTEKS